jgi:hypothetical protein
MTSGMKKCKENRHLLMIPRIFMEQTRSVEAIVLNAKFSLN